MQGLGRQVSKCGGEVNRCDSVIRRHHERNEPTSETREERFERYRTEKKVFTVFSAQS